MAYQTGTLTTRARLYDMTGASAANQYTPSAGVDLGKVSDLIIPEFERDVVVYKGLEYGSTPKHASIDGSGVILQFALSEYNSGVMSLLAQRMKPSGDNLNYQGAMAASYKLGKLLTSSEWLKLLVADETTPADYPKLYIPKAVVIRVRGLALSMASRMMDSAVFEVIGLHDTNFNGPFAFGDSSGFPALS